MGVQFFGQFLLEENVIKREQLLDAIEYQESQNLKLGDYAVKKNFISAADADRINQLQQSKDLRFGEAAVELGLLSNGQVEELITAQKNDRVYLGDAVVTKGYATQEQIDKALAEFKEQQSGYHPNEVELPAEVPDKELASTFFDLTHKLLLRMGGIENKLTPAKLASGSVNIPGERVQITFSGNYNTRYILGVPEIIARKMAKKLINADDPSQDELIDIVREFANVVCGNILARLAQGGKNADISPPEDPPADVALDNEKAVQIDIATPDGDVVTVITF